MRQEVSKILEISPPTQVLPPTSRFSRLFPKPAAANATRIARPATLSAVANARRGRDQRLVSRCRVEFDRPSGPVEAETEDLSGRGLFIRTEALLPVGEETDLRLTLPD